MTQPSSAKRLTRIHHVHGRARGQRVTPGCLRTVNSNGYSVRPRIFEPEHARHTVPICP